MQGQYNMRSPAVKRLMKEAQELKDPTELYHAQPLEDNLFEWHFTLRGPEDSEFDGGIYHGRIILPPEYPMKPPSIILLTPNGRFEIFKKICLSISGHHPESWQPSWSIRTALLAIIGFMPTHGGGAIGSLDYTPEERKVLARKSQDWKCPDCGDVSKKLKPRTEASEKASQEAKELASQINFQGEKTGASPAKPTDEGSASPAAPTPTASTPSPDTTTPAPIPPPFPYPWGMPQEWTPQNQEASAAPGVPRFPYPPPFMGLPPRMFFNPHPGQGAPPVFPPMPFFPPMMRGFSPFPSQAAGMGTSTATASSSQQQSASAQSVASACPQVSTPPVSTAVSSSVAGTTTASTVTAGASTTGSSTSVTSAETVGAAAAPSSASAASSSSTTTSPSTNTASASTPASSTTTPTAATELRQRTTQSQSTTTASSTTTTSSPASQSQQATGSYSRETLMIMVMLCLVISLLLLRRVYLLYSSRDFKGYFE